MKSEQKKFRFYNLTHWFYTILVCVCVLLSSKAFTENRVEAERQNWESFTNRSYVRALLRSGDGKTLWIGANGGLEKRDAISGDIQGIYTKQNGLPSNTVSSICLDTKGGIWVGTWDGLAHLQVNGTWEIFTKENSGLPDNGILSLCNDGKGGVWAGTYYGLAHMKSDNSWVVFNEDNSELPGNNILALLYDQKGYLWIGTEKEDWLDGWLVTATGLACLKQDGSWEIFNNDNSDLPDNRITSLESDGEGGLWIGTGVAAAPIFNGSGLVHLKADKTWEIFTHDDLSDNLITSISSDGQGGLWVGTLGSLAHFNSEGNWEFFNRDNSEFPFHLVTALSYDSYGGLWIGTWDALIHLKSDNSWVIDEGKSGLPGNFISSLVSDDQGGIWIGTGYIEAQFPDGIANLRADGTWMVYDTDNSDLPDNWIESLLSDGHGGVWVGMFSSGLAHLNSNGLWDIFNTDNSGLPGYNVSSLLLDGDQGIWIGTGDQGVAYFSSDGSWEIFNKDNSNLSGNHVTSLISDKQGGIWVGTWDGVTHFNSDGSSTYYDEQNSDLSDNLISALYFEEDRGLWIGTQDGGLCNLKSDGKWEIFDIRNSGLPDYDYVSSIISDNEEGIWIGTLYSGIANIKKDGSWDVFNIYNSGLTDGWRNSIIPDGNGGLWIATFGGGLSHFLQLGTPEQLIKPNSPEMTINWFLKSSSLDYQNVKYIELQRSLSQDGVYETVLDASDKLIRFYADYSICPKPRVDNCWVTVEGHTPATRTNSDTSTTKGYTLNTPINDPEWLEGLPRYYRLSAVIEEDDKLIRVANNSEAALITPQVEEKPRVELTLDRNAIAMQPNTKAEITVFVSSLDLFRGDVALEVESAADNTISNNIKMELEPAAVSLKAGETKPVLLIIEALSATLSTADVAGSTIKIIPKIASGYSGKSTSLNVQVGDGTTPKTALSIAHKTKRTRVLDALTISGNVIPAQAGQKVVISGNNIKESVDSSNSSESLTVTTDENGYFQGTVTPIHAGLLTLTAQSNSITSNSAEIFILPAQTNIALSSNVNQSTQKGDMLRVQGIITPVRLDKSQIGTEINDTKVNLDIRYLDPANQNDGFQPQFVGDVAIDEKGVFYRDIVVPGNGFLNVKAGLPETADYLNVNTKLVIPIGQPVGEGIIVVSESGDADFQTISKSLGNYVYNALKSRNIPAERIKYLGSAYDPEFTNGAANKANLHDALTNWATSLFSTDDPYKTPLNLYLIGKVEDGNNGFRLNDSEVLTADDLAQYLNEAEEIIKINSKDNYSEYKGFPVTIVLEGTQSGKWIEKIAGNGRIILTSSSDKPVDEGGFAGYDNFGESSFSRYFYQFINYGSDIEGSFAEAGYEILKFYRHTQRPVMDADGDGVGTTKFDRYEASGKFIEYRPSGNLRPQIRTTNPDMTINKGDAQNNFIWAIATDPENEMQGVFCSITDPSNRTVNIEMQLDTGYFYKADLHQNYPSLATGCYQAVYYAKDKAGNVSLPEQKFLNVIASSGVLLEAPKMKITTNGNMVTISWSEVANAYGYRLFYCNYPDCSPSDIGEIDMGNQREITFDGRGFAFYGAVKAYNSNGKSLLSNIEFFDLR